MTFRKSFGAHIFGFHECIRKHEITVDALTFGHSFSWVTYNSCRNMETDFVGGMEIFWKK